MTEFRASAHVLERLVMERNIGVLPMCGVPNAELSSAIRKAGFAAITFRGRLLDDPAAHISATMVVGHSGDDKGGLKGFMRRMRREVGVGAALLRAGGGGVVVLEETSERPWQGPSSDIPAMVTDFCSFVCGRPCLIENWDHPQTWFARYSAWLQGRS